MSVQEVFDALIIGGGPAGISCAAELKDSGLTSLVLEKSSQLGGQLSEIPNPLRNFAGGNYLNGEELRDKLVELVGSMQLNFLLNASITEVDLVKKTILADGKKYAGRTILLATGYRVNRLGLADESKFGLDVVYRTGHCLDHMKGHAVAIVGGGDSAIGDALELAEMCPRVYLLHRSDELRARPDWLQKARENSRIEFLLSTKVVALVPEKEDELLKSLKALKVVNGQGQSEIAVERLVVKIGYAPNTELFRGKVEMDAAGHISIDNYCATSVPGVFAAGDIVVPGYPRIATAVGHGVMAVAGMRTFLGQSL